MTERQHSPRADSRAKARDGRLASDAVPASRAEVARSQTGSLGSGETSDSGEEQERGSDHVHGLDA